MEPEPDNGQERVFLILLINLVRNVCSLVG